MNELSPNTTSYTFDKYATTFLCSKGPLLMISIHVYNWKWSFRDQRYSRKISGYVTNFPLNYGKSLRAPTLQNTCFWNLKQIWNCAKFPVPESPFNYSCRLETCNFTKKRLGRIVLPRCFWNFNQISKQIWNECEMKLKRMWNEFEMNVKRVRSECETD